MAGSRSVRQFASAVGKQRELNAGARLTFSFLLLASWLME